MKRPRRAARSPGGRPTVLTSARSPRRRRPGPPAPRPTASSFHAPQQRQRRPAAHLRRRGNAIDGEPGHLLERRHARRVSRRPDDHHPGRGRPARHHRAVQQRRRAAGLHRRHLGRQRLAAPPRPSPATPPCSGRCRSPRRSPPTQVRITVTADQATRQGRLHPGQRGLPGPGPRRPAVPSVDRRLRQGRRRLPAASASPGLRQQPRRAARVLRDHAVPHRPLRLHPLRQRRRDHAGHRPVRGAGTRRATWTDTARAAQTATKVCADGLHGFRYLKISLDALAADAPPPSPTARSPSTRSRSTSRAYLGTPDSYRGWFQSLRRPAQPVLVRRLVHQRAGHRHVPARRHRPARRRLAHASTASSC